MLFILLDTLLLTLYNDYLLHLLAVDHVKEHKETKMTELNGWHENNHIRAYFNHGARVMYLPIHCIV